MGCTVSDAAVLALRRYLCGTRSVVVNSTTVLPLFCSGKLSVCYCKRLSCVYVFECEIHVVSSSLLRHLFFPRLHAPRWCVRHKALATG